MEVLDLGCPTLELYFSTLVTMVTLTPEKIYYRLSDYFLLYFSLYSFILCSFIDMKYNIKMTH